MDEQARAFTPASLRLVAPTPRAKAFPLSALYNNAAATAGQGAGGARLQGHGSEMIQAADGTILNFCLSYFALTGGRLEFPGILDRLEPRDMIVFM
ncbi:hypothetical protein NDU88_008921 [Pleurodeles waltl]|uniref:Uncharacterized protein n=1 Tax=Pleurodeles waltl TaxID=8319 RepID=A0AAV7P0C8_PLEWA|nr:hypothetical protein NDU88_008921 [Pleurodeles waltl]